MGRILVVRGGALGDFILTLPAIRLLRDNFPDAHLEILGYRHILSVTEGRYYADATRSIEYAALAGFFVPNADLAPDLVEYFGAFHQVISYLYDPDGFFEANIKRCGVRYFLSASPKITGSEHAAQQLAKPLQSLALYLESAAAEVFPNEKDKLFATKFLAPLRQEVIALHPGSGSPGKNWPKENWLELGKRLHEAGHNLLLVGGEADGPILDFLQQHWQFSVTLARDLPLPHLAAVFAKCSLFVGHDSGVSHLAAASGVRCVLLFGPTDPSVWAPANGGVRLITSGTGAMESIRLKTVEAEILKALVH